MKKNLFKRAMAMGLSVLMVSGLSGCNGSEGKDFTLEGGDPNDLPQQISMMADTVVLPENGLSNFCDEFKKQTGIGLSVEKPDHAKYYERLHLHSPVKNRLTLLKWALHIIQNLQIQVRYGI